jgi:hypothetical protein
MAEYNYYALASWPDVVAFLASLQALADKLCWEGINIRLSEEECQALACFYRMEQAGWLEKREILREARLSTQSLALLGIAANGEWLRKMRRIHSQQDG